MARVRPFFVSAAGAVVAAGVLAPVAAGAEPGTAATTCQGKPVTIVATSTVTSGTEGDDVVAMTPLGWSVFDALGGNDTICLAAGASRGGRDPLPPQGLLDAGAGDDTVVNESAPGLGAEMRVGLGAGADTYAGNDAHEQIHTDTSFGAPDAPVPPGDQRDVVTTGTGRDFVRTNAAEGALNEDHITAAGEAVISYRGTMGPTGALDVSSANAPRLLLQLPAATPAPVTGLVLDATSRTARLEGSPVLRWTGEIRTFQLQGGPAAGALPVSFTGTDAAEHVTVSEGTLRDFRLGGGDDRLVLEPAWGPIRVPAVTDGGAGHDALEAGLDCAALTLRLAGSASCDATSGVLTGFEVAAASSLSSAHLTLIGTSAPDSLRAMGSTVTLKGRGGNDTLVAAESGTVELVGGDGRDRLHAQGTDVVLRGDAGADRLILGGRSTAWDWDVARLRQLALGGRGRDVLHGTDLTRGDRLFGGRGTDRAHGHDGRRDVCRAETTRGCERS